MSERIDWTTTEGCPRCNEYGPFLPAGLLTNPEAARDAHRVWHALAVGLFGPPMWVLDRAYRGTWR